MMIRELAIGLTLSFAAAVVVGAVMTAGSVIGGSMELNSGAILRGAIVESPNISVRRVRRARRDCCFSSADSMRCLLALAQQPPRAAARRAPLPDPRGMIKLGGQCSRSRSASGFR